jgi:hypothetical protein
LQGKEDFSDVFFQLYFPAENPTVNHNSIPFA